MKPKHIKIKNKVISNSNIERKILNKIDKYYKCFDRDNYPIHYLMFKDCDIKNLDFVLNNLKKSIAECNNLVYIFFYNCRIQHLAISNDNDNIEFCFRGCEIDDIKFIPFFDWSDYKHKNSVFSAIRFNTCEIRWLTISNSSITTSLNIVNSNVSYGCIDDGSYKKNVIVDNQIKNLIVLNSTIKYITIDNNEIDRFVMKRVSILNEINKPTSSIKCDWDKLTLLEENDIDNRCLNDDWCFKVTKLNTEEEEADKRYYYYFPKADKIFSNYSTENYACTKGYLILYTKYISLDEFSTKINCYAKHADANDFTLKQYNALYDYFYKIREIFKD